MLRDLLNQVVTVQSQDGVNWSTGEPSWGTPRTVRCRIESKLQMVRKPDNTEVQSISTLYTDEPIGIGDRIWLPGENTSDPNVAHTPINILGTPDLAGRPCLWTIFL